MHPAAVERAADLLQHVLTPRIRRQAGAITDVVTAHHDNARVPVGAQQRRDRTHHHVKAAIRLQVTHHVADQFLRGLHLVAAERDDTPAQLGSRAADIEVYPLGQHRDPALRPGGVGAELECGRRLAQARIVQRQQVDDVLGTYPRGHVGRRRKLRVEPDVEAVKVVVEFMVAEQRRVRPHVVDVQQLPPAMMADDDVGREAQRF